MRRPGSNSSLLLICLACAGWAASFGLGSQVVSHWLAGHGYSNTVIGINHSAYYLGLALASLAVPRLMARGARRCAIAGMFFSGATLAAFPFAGGDVGYFVMRLLNGMAGALSVVPLETLVSRDSPPEERTRRFGFYGVALSLGGAVGICAGLHGCQPGSRFAFYLGGALPVLSGLALMRWLSERTLDEEPGQEGGLEIGRNFLSLGTAWGQGFLEGGMLAFLSLYLVSLGLSTEEAGNWMGLTMIGVIVFQVPVGSLADRLGRLPVLWACYAVVCVSLLAVPYLGADIWLALVLFAFGACAGAMYPLGLSMLGERTPEAALARAYSWYLAMECVGSQLGALAMGAARDRWGDTSMFGVAAAALVAVLGVAAILRSCRPANPPMPRSAFSPGALSPLILLRNSK